LPPGTKKARRLERWRNDNAGTVPCLAGQKTTRATALRRGRPREGERRVPAPLGVRPAAQEEERSAGEEERQSRETDAGDRRDLGHRAGVEVHDLGDLGRIQALERVDRQADELGGLRRGGGLRGLAGGEVEDRLGLARRQAERVGPERVVVAVD